MLLKIINYKSQITLFILSIVGFALIRNFEDRLFYDPFLTFFKGLFAEKPLPKLIEWKLYLSLFFRYFLNSALSVFIIYVLFKNKEHIKLAATLYVFFFLILMLLLIVVLHFYSDRLMAIFYIRRFIIQPIFLLLFIPGFYFQQEHIKKQNP